MQRIKFLRSPFIVAAIICFAIAIAIPLLVRDSGKEIKGVSKKNNATATSTLVPTDLPEVTYSYKQTSASSPTAVQTNSNSNQQDTSANSGQTVPTSVPTQTTPTFQVSLKINDSSVGNIDLQQGANQCDVLTRAKDQGKISQLLMKYDNSLGTYGVYQINGIGKENAVWWVYKVNGTSPSQGCSYIKANGGDSVEWEYVGS
jgi:hypothetical protein